MSNNKKIWYRTLDELFAAKGGKCDYVFLNGGASYEMHIGEFVIDMDYTPMRAPLEKEGMVYFDALDLFVPENEIDEGIYVENDDFDKRMDEVCGEEDEEDEEE